MEFEYTLSSLERQEQLRQFVEQQQRVTVNQICQQFEVSPATARRDLEALAERGEIERFHGGAKALRQAPPEAPALQRGVEQADEKRRIGRAAAELVQDGETVFLGSGTTVLEVARNLRGHRNLTVITNSLLVINALADVPDMTVVGLGGILRPSEMSMIGHLTEQALAEVNAHKIIMGIRALDAKHGLSNDYLPETMTDRAILSRSGEIILVADHTKCDRVSTAYVAPLETIDTLVTDSGVSAEFITDLTEKDIRVIAV
jgi:DeoR/GlpR family transcriptional regulator of sugar metabolism